MNNTVQNKSESDNEREGVIKFRLQHTDVPIRIDATRLAEFNSWRLLMYRVQLLGQNAQRYDGLAFGNVSQRKKPGSNEFYISGTQTSGKELLEASDLCLVTAVDLPTNQLSAQGVVKPSSEALTHASVYQHKKNAHAVIHGHNPEIWQQAQALKLPVTPENIAYGTPEIALAVTALLNELSSDEAGVFVMLGHVDGFVVFGPDLETAALLMIQTWGKAQQSSLR